MLRVRIPIWSALNRLQRILLGVVVLVVVLFIVTVASGGSERKADPAQPPGFVTWLGDLFGEPGAVEAADLSADCLPPEGLPPDGRLAIDGSCVLRVAARDADLRRLTLKAEGAVTVQAPVPRGEDTATKELASDDQVDVSVDSDGAEITLTCFGAASCAVLVS
jgi:hypothetical protein